MKAQEAARQSDPASLLKDARAEIRSLQKEVKARVSDIDSMRKHVEAARRANQKQHVRTMKRPSTKGALIRVMAGDLHGCMMHKPSVSAFIADLKALAPDEIILLGDMLECGGFLAQHHTLGYVAQTEYCYEDDIAATNQVLDAMIAAAPKAEVYYLEGNHEHRVERWCVDQAVSNQKDAAWLRRQVAPDVVLDLAGRGITYYRQGEFYDGLAIPGTIRRGRCYFTHGISSAKHAAALHVQKFNSNVVFGHKHAQQAFTINTVHEPVIGGWCPGCLCLKQPMWMHTRPTDWVHGYAVQTVARSGEFQHVNVVIVDGKSLLMPLRKVGG